MQTRHERMLAKASAKGRAAGRCNRTIEAGHCAGPAYQNPYSSAALRAAWAMGEQETA